MLFPFSTKRTVFKQKSSGAMEKPPELFCVMDHRWQLVGEVRFCFAVTLLVSWTGKAEFCDPRKITWTVASAEYLICSLHTTASADRAGQVTRHAVYVPRTRSPSRCGRVVFCASCPPSTAINQFVALEPGVLAALPEESRSGHEHVYREDEQEVDHAGTIGGTAFRPSVPHSIVGWRSA
jgi:hypothetical protein